VTFSVVIAWASVWVVEVACLFGGSGIFPGWVIWSAVEGPVLPGKGARTGPDAKTLRTCWRSLETPGCVQSIACRSFG